MNERFSIMGTIRIFALLLLVAVVSAQYNPFKDPNICGRPTCKGNGKFRYRPGMQQTYKYSVEISSLFNGTSKNESTIFVEGTAILDFVTQCDGLLTLQDVKLSENPLKDDAPDHANSYLFAEGITENTLRFSFNDGIITEVCPKDEEKAWVLNFKKGILSMLHNTMKRFDLDYETEEDDVRGTCKTSYRVKGANGTSLIVEKTKDLHSCIGRAKLHSVVQSVPYNFRPVAEDPLLMKSTSTCQLSIDHYVYNGVECEERHVFQPFSNGDAGATTVVKQRLILLEEIEATVDEQDSITRRTTLRYDHVPTPKPTSGELKASRDLIRKLCRLSADDVQAEFSDLFTQFIHSSRPLSYTALKTLYDHAARICTTGRKHILDALPYLSNGASVSLMKDIILSGAVPKSNVDEWMLSIAFIRRPDEEMLEAVAELLENTPRDASTSLSIAALTRSYCAEHLGCFSNDAVSKIVRLLQDVVLEASRTDKRTRSREDDTIVALKALSNIGVVTEEFVDHLQHVIQDHSEVLSIRIAAVEVFRRLSCEEHRAFFENFLKNQNEDAEVRIAAYLQIMRCPNYVVIRTIKHCLEVEEVNQVGSFIWSHLNNILKSSIPSRVEIQGLLSDRDLDRKFSNDIRKFSHNFEGSTFFEEYNIGANYESNVIFSPSSYIPRTGMLNLTVDLFGESINLLEVYGRVQGFEHYLESIFGPKGPLNSQKLQDKIPKMRWARDVSAVEELKGKIEGLSNVVENTFEQPKVSLGLKVFGNELKYASFDGDAEIKAALASLNPVDHLTRILSGREINYSKAAMFMDTSYVVASGAGLPLSLNAVGTSSVNMKLSGSLSMPDFAKKKELDLTGNIQPSIALDIVGTMSVDAYYASSGIKLKTNVYTSSALEGNVKIRGNKLVSIKFSIPRETTEIFGAKSELIVMKNNKEEPQKGLVEKKVSQSLCSWPAVENTIGLKLCADYHYTNVTKVPEAPYSILAGPAGFRVSLQKYDPTAKTYVLEYKWTHLKNSSVISLTFDTPGSSLRRVLGANLTLDTESNNLTLLLQSTAGNVLAKGRYKNTPEDKYLQITLDVNDKQHLDASCSLQQKEIRNGFTYYPKFYLGVNGERVAELQGTLKSVSKKGISQYDVDLKFQTKRLTSKLFGYISKTDASVATNLKLDYKFANTKEQRVVFDFSLANRSSRNIVVILGDCSLTSTAYPHFNFDTFLKLQRGTGHTELKFELNSSPLPKNDPETDYHKLAFQVLVSHKILKYSTQINAVASLKRTSTDMDMGVKFAFDISGPDTNAHLVVRYAKDKDVSVAVFWSHPRSNFERIVARLNVTIPSFKSMIVEVRLDEKQTADYRVVIKGTWFSGHQIEMKGVYQDMSKPSTANYHLKFELKSPSFEDIHTDIIFYRDNQELILDAKADQDKDSYGVFLKHTTKSPFEITTEGKLKYKTKLYSITSSLQLKEQRQISIELHIDQFRDIHFAAWGYGTETRKAAGMEIKWDANRDPNQKLAVTVDLSNPEAYVYGGNFVISYPGRTVNGVFDFAIRESFFATSSRLSWSTEESVVIRIKANYQNDVKTFFFLESELMTPFAEWRRTALTGGFLRNLNMYRANGSLCWHDNQQVSFDLLADYNTIGSTFMCEFSGSVVSTVHDIASLSLSVKHKHNATKVDTNLNVTYHPQQVVLLRSNWQIDENSESRNLTGTVSLLSPFKGYNRGLLVSKIYLSNRIRYLRGVADLDLDHNKYTASVEGRMTKLTRSMLEFNVTTPLEKYNKMTGRFGINDENKHVVAEIIYPTGSVGTELLFNVDSIADFDVKFSLATPLDFLQRILIVGKLKEEEADFRLGWNSLLAGFVGVWHYVNVTDFQYSYKIYTPIEGFEENGIVVKLLLKEGLDSEVSVKLAQYKLGVTLVGKPKPKILNELGIKTQEIYNGERLEETEADGDSYEEYDEDEYEEPISWAGLLEIDTFIYPTMKGTLDIDQKGTLYVIQGTLVLPDGKAVLNDQFDMTDVFKMKNRFQLSTPYESYRIVTSNYDFQIMPGYQYLLGLDLNYQNRTRWIKGGLFACYETQTANDNYDRFNVTLHVHTPFESFPSLDVQAILATEGDVYQTNFSITTNSSDISAAARALAREEFLDAKVDLHVLSPVFVVPPLKLHLKKDFNDIVSFVELNFDMLQGNVNSYKLDTGFHYKSIHDFDGHAVLKTPFRGMENTEGKVKVFIDKETADISAFLFLFPLELDVQAALEHTVLNATAVVDFNGKRNVALLACNILNTTSTRRYIQGNITIEGKRLSLDGSVDVVNNMPVAMHVQMTPDFGIQPIVLKYEIKPHGPGYGLKARIEHVTKFADFDARTVVKSKFDWDLHLQMDTSHEEYKTFLVNAKAAEVGGNRSFAIDAITPLKKMEKLRLSASFAEIGEGHSAMLFYELAGIRGDMEAELVWIFLENMRAKFVGDHYGPNYANHVEGEAFYVNPKRAFKFLTLGGHADLNRIWTMASNLTVTFPGDHKVTIDGKLKFPPPNNETHIAVARLDGGKNMDNVKYLVSYSAMRSGESYASSGNISYGNRERIGGNVQIEWNEKRVNNYLDWRRLGNDVNLVYKLRTPKFVDQETLVTEMTYKPGGGYHNVTCKAFYPERRTVGYAYVDFRELANMNGTVNVTTPFERFNYTGANFRTETNALVYNRYFKLFWPNNTALLSSKCDIRIGPSPTERYTKGLILVEVPLATRHVASVDYTYEEKLQLSTGRATVEYNSSKVLEGKYNCLSESRAGLDKDTIHVELQNKFLPIGADYIHSFGYNAPGDGSNTPTVDSKKLNLYNLEDSKKFNVTGQVIVRVTETGQQISLVARHPNRTVKFTTDYDVVNQRFKQHSRLELAPTAWLEYRLDLLNKTADENSEAQEIQINISYPRRNFTAIGSYNISHSSMSSDMSLIWDKERKTLEAGLDWRRDESHPNRQEVQLQINHPSFEKNISFLGEYESTDRKYADVRLKVDYSANPSDTLNIGAILENNSVKYLRNYTYSLWATHPTTELDLNAMGGVYWRPKWYHIAQTTNYKRSYLPMQSGETAAKLDVNNNEIELKRKALGNFSYLWGRYAGKFPLYTANVSAIHGNDINATGEFYLNFIEKLLQLELNMTTDGSQSLHMYGIIPNSRSASFNVWRDHEEIRISDISYFLRMNHSRLIVSSLRWRPELKQNIQNGIRAASVGLYNDIIENTDSMKQYIRSETVEAITDIWKCAKPYVHDFLEDLRGLKVIEEDLEELQVFLNNSYHANEFYIRDIVGFVIYVFDELSIKSHIESLPAIVSEIWEVMGDTGKKIQKSILWVIEKIKHYYKNAAEFVNGLVQGDSVEQVSETLKMLVEKYDNFIKDLHVRFIRYMEELWKHTYSLMVDNWHRTLASIEPTFIKIVHYLETIVWNTSKEFLDFLYMRKNEIIEHPYFSKFSNFTQDLDRFYKDMTGNDTIASVYKYTKVLWNFLKDKYFKLVPFGKELQDVVSEILNELNELRKLPSVQYLTEKYNQLYAKARWLYEYFDMETRIHRFITLIHRKLTDMTQTALQAENRYREPKTKFIFEPSDGIMHLEQKLPMSWHAFDETPKFQEIPELKTIYDLQKYFTISKTTFWSVYYDYKPFTDPTDWLPPFQAQAMIVGGGHFVTFDRIYYSFRGKCAYLLASDFLDRNFSIAVSYDTKNARSEEVLVLLNNTIIAIDIFNNSVKVGNSETTRLPVEIGDALLYQEADIVTLESQSGFLLQCNMKFHICILEASGWYFGKTAGLWGTINNEPSDDLLSSDGTRFKTTEAAKFAGSWALDERCTQGERRGADPSRTPPDEVRGLCEAIFASKVSPFVTCFPRISSGPFLGMCLNSTSEEEACTSALAYMNLCSYANTPLRIPDSCVKCNLPNGTALDEGEYIQLEGDDVPQSADVVFIVEAKECNKDVRSNRKLDHLVELLNKELLQLNVTNNRYSVVVFGGDGAHNRPRVVSMDGRIFANHTSVVSYFDAIPAGNGNSDIFEAIVYANQLVFRPGVSKNFVLLPCSDCSESNMKLDYAILHQLLLENDVSLHILMNEDFPQLKTRGNKIFFGVDRTRAYTKKDQQSLKGDTSLRAQVRLPKSTLGFCTPLALESNGSVFSAKKLLADKPNGVRKAVGVFAKRIAQTAIPSDCKICECTAANSGVSYMECFPCSYPTRGSIEQGLDEDETLDVLQPGDKEHFLKASSQT